MSVPAVVSISRKKFSEVNMSNKVNFTKILYQRVNIYRYIKIIMGPGMRML